jgi:ABC-2 type transport system permease protein
MTATLTTPVPVASSTRSGSPASAIPFRRLVSVEWSKATDTRAARWLLLTIAVASAGFLLVPMLNQGAQTYEHYLMFPALVLGTLLPIVSIMTLTGEWTQRTVLTTFTQEPRRGRVVNAKVVVSVLLGLVGALFGAVTTAVALGIVAATGRHLDADLSVGVLLGFLLFIALNVLMGVAFGALLHNTAAAIVLFLVLPTAFGILGAAVESLGHWLDPSTTFGWVLDNDWGGHTPQILTGTLLWVVVPLVGGLVRTVRREIK